MPSDGIIFHTVTFIDNQFTFLRPKRRLLTNLQSARLAPGGNDWLPACTVDERFFVSGIRSQDRV